MKQILRFLREYWKFSLAMLALVGGLGLQFGGQPAGAHWVLSIVSLIIVLPIMKDMWADLRTGKYGIDILAITAIVASLLLKQYWAAIVIVVMLTGGEALEDYAGHRAKTELDTLLSLAPTKATVVRKGKAIEVPIGDIRVGDTLLIRPGEVVPVDAEIVDGQSEFDESSLTGESLPQAKKPGDQLLSGSVDIDGAITAKCLRAAKDSQYEQIIKLVRAAEHSQAPVVRLADRYSVPFTLASYCIALSAWYFGHGGAIRFLEVIVVATPCPLLLAAPIAVISGMSRAAKHGIIVKNGGALERLGEAKTIAFDKTGTLTLGEPTVDTVTAFAPTTKQMVLSLSASLEQNSNHVLAKAIVNKAKQSNVKVTKAKHVRETAGRGLAASVSGKTVLVGRLDFLQESSVELPPKFTNMLPAQTATYVAIDGKLAGCITFKDIVRSESKQTITTIRKLGLDTLMVTGDNKTTAQAIAKHLGIGHVHAEMLPGDKLRVLEETDRPVAFVGDGVNDAPVLTAADIGIALGARGSTAASESADMVIMLDDITRVERALTIARRTFSIARQSILGGIALSTILMLVFATGKFPPLAGAILQEVVDVIVILNALRAHGSWRTTQIP